MRKGFVLLLLLSLVFIGCNSLAEPFRIRNDIIFGMSQEQIRKFESPRKPNVDKKKTEDTEDGDYVISYYRHDDVFQRIPVTVCYFFKENKMNCFFYCTSGTEALALYDLLKPALTEKYGVPLFNESNKQISNHTPLRAKKELDKYFTSTSKLPLTCKYEQWELHYDGGNVTITLDYAKLQYKNTDPYYECALYYNFTPDEILVKEMEKKQEEKEAIDNAI